MYVEGHQALEHLQGLAQTIPQKRVWRRFQAVILAKQGRTAADIAQSLGCSRRAVKNWVAQDNRGGVAALRERPHPGRPRRLAPDQYPRLTERLDAPPRPEDGAGTLRGLDVQRILEQEFGVVLSLQAVYDLLHRLTLAPQHDLPRNGHDAVPLPLLADRRIRHAGVQTPLGQERTTTGPGLLLRRDDHPTECPLDHRRICRIVVAGYQPRAAPRRGGP